MDGGQFAALLVRHDRRLLRYILTLMPRRGDAEEVLQRTATALWEHFAEYDPTRDFFPWAVRFAYFEVLNYRKEWARDRLVFRSEVLEELIDTRASLDGMLERRREALLVCLRQLVPQDVDLLRRRYCSPETIAMLARELDATAKTLYRRLDRIRERLEECVSRRVASSTAEEA
ncbi:MAG: sigma-70 family RNA polymerase sigma factor [Planctomycetota bacterium]